MVSKTALLILVITPVVASPILSQTSATIDGTVRDGQGLVVPGVLVTLSGRTVLGDPTTTTVQDGSYRFRALRPGIYDLHYKLSGFQSLRRKGIVVEGNRTVTVNATLEVATLAETVTVTGESPVVDFKNTSLSNQFDTTELQDTPSSTDLWGVLGQTPGVKMGGYDVGGSHKGQQSGYESFGVRSQNRVLSEGVDSTEGSGAAGVYYDYYSIEEFTTSAAGSDVEMTSGGSMIVMTVKSGGNDFSGLFHTDYEGEGFVANNETDELRARGYTGNPTLLFYEIHADVGGPIVKDKFWFFGFFNNFKIEKQISGVDPSDGRSIEDIRQFGGKLTWKISDRDQFTGYTQYQLKHQPNRGISVARPPDSTLDMQAWAWVHKAEWQRIWSERAFSNVQVKHYGLDADFPPRVDFTTNPPRVDMATGAWSGAGWLPGKYGRWKPQFSATLNYYLPAEIGAHDFKFGFDWQIDSSRSGTTGRSGSIVYFDNSRLGRPYDVSEISLFNLPPEGTNPADDRDRHTDFFVQDTWTLSDRLTLMLGFRFGQQDVYYTDSVVKPEQSDFFPTGTIPGKDLVTWSVWAPRIGVTFDLTGEGETVLKAHYGRYVNNIADWLSSANPAGLAQLGYKFIDPNGNGRYDGPHELGPLIYQSGTVGGSLEEAEGTEVNPNLETAYTDELGVSFEHELFAHSSLRFSYVRKQQRNLFDEWNPAQVLPLLNNPVPCGGNLFPCPSNPFTGEPITTVVRVPGEAAFAQSPIIDTLPGEFGDNEFDTVQLALSRRFNRRFFIQASFDYQWRNELRSARVDARSPLIADPIGTFFFQNHNPAVSNQQNSTSWVGRILGRYVLPAGVATSGKIRHQSGFPWSPIHRVSFPGSGTMPFFLENLENNRAENVTVVDLRLEKVFELGERAKLTGIVDVYNLFNSNPVTNFSLRTGGAFGKIIGVLEPRVIKVGVRFQF